MKGKPKFKYGDRVAFPLGDTIKEGIVYIIDKYGTFDNPNDVSYDIMVENENTLYKHITESKVSKVRTKNKNKKKKDETV